MLLNVIIFGALFVVSTAYVRLSPTSKFRASEERCKSKHSNLAIVTSNADFVNGQANCGSDNTDVSCWTGLTIGPGDTWEWIDGNPASYGFNTEGVPTNTDGNPWFMEDGSPKGSGNCVIFDKDHGFKWTITECDRYDVDGGGEDAVAYPLCNLRKHQFEANCDCVAPDCEKYKPEGGCTEWEKGSCTTGCGLSDGSCECTDGCTPTPENYFLGGNGKVGCEDGTDCALKPNTCTCVQPDCTLFDHFNTCTKPGCDLWKKRADYKTPRYYTNGVVVALVGAIEWIPTVLAMGTGAEHNNIMFQIKEPNDCPYFAQEFSVTNVDGIDCVVRVEPIAKPNSHTTTHCNVILESWSTPIVYVKAGSDYSAKSWFVENVQDIAAAGVNPTAAKDIFRFLSAYETVDDVYEAGDSNKKTLSSYSWVEFDGIVWISQGSNLAGGSDMLQPIYEPEVQPEPEPEPVSFGLENNKKLENKFSKWVVYGDSLFITILIVVIASSFFGLCGGIGIKLVSMRMNKIYYQKLVQKDIDSP